MLQTCKWQQRQLTLVAFVDVLGSSTVLAGVVTDEVLRVRLAGVVCSLSCAPL